MRKNRFTLIAFKPLRGKIELPEGGSRGGEAVWTPEVFKIVLANVNQNCADFLRAYAWAGARPSTICPVEARHYRPHLKVWDVEDLYRDREPFMARTLERSVPRYIFRYAAMYPCVALLGSFGSVYLSVGLGLKACPLCFYQRSFMMASAVSLATSIWLDGLRSHRACLIALPFAWAGLGVAGFHEYLVLSAKLECPPALFGWGDASKKLRISRDTATSIIAMIALL